MFCIPCVLHRHRLGPNHSPSLPTARSGFLTSTLVSFLAPRALPTHTESNVFNRSHAEGKGCE